MSSYHSWGSVRLLLGPSLSWYTGPEQTTTHNRCSHWNSSRGSKSQETACRRCVYIYSLSKSKSVNCWSCWTPTWLLKSIIKSMVYSGWRTQESYVYKLVFIYFYWNIKIREADTKRMDRQIGEQKRIDKKGRKETDTSS